MTTKHIIGLGFIGMGIGPIVILAVIARPRLSAGPLQGQIADSSEALIPAAAGSIGGTVMADGRPLPEAEVFLALAGSHQWQTRTFTDDSGRFELNGLSRRAYTV